MKDRGGGSTGNGMYIPSRFSGCPKTLKTVKVKHNLTGNLIPHIMKVTVGSDRRN